MDWLLGVLKHNRDEKLCVQARDTYPTPSFKITENNAMPTPSPDIVIISTNCLRRLK